MKLKPSLNHVYLNEAFSPSTMSIHLNHNNSECSRDGVIPGSKEFILFKDENMGDPKEDCSALDRIRDFLKKYRRRVFNKKTLHKRLPIIRWLPTYSIEDAMCDVVAGLSVGLTVIPQALAYAGIAGLPVESGLYSSFAGCFVYIFLGTCKDVPFGPSAIVSLLTYQVAEGSWKKSVLLCLMCGIIELLMGLLGLGFLIDFVSGPVSSGFTSAVALIILSSQIQSILGITTNGNTFVEVWIQIFSNIQNTRTTDTILGVICIAILIILRMFAGPPVPAQSEEEVPRSHFLHVGKKIFWIVGTARNAILVLVCCLMGYLLDTEQQGTPFRIIGEVPQGLPTIQWPNTSMFANETKDDNSQDFFEMMHSMGSGLIVIPLISLMESIAIAKAFAYGQPIDASQELIAIGTANILNSFILGFPGTGALSRGAVFNASGVRTTFANVYSGTLVIISLLFLTPYLYYIPRATLGAIIIAAVVLMIEVKVLKPIWRAKASDLASGVGTFIACLVFPLEYGILTGIGINIAFILYTVARPKLEFELLITQSGIEYLMIRPDRCLIFPSVEYIRNWINKYSKRHNIPVVVDASHVYAADFTCATVITNLIDDFNQRQQLLFFFNLKPSISELFTNVSELKIVVYYNEEQLEHLLKKLNYSQRPETE